MEKVASSPISRLIRRMVEDRQFRDLPDQELLERFREQQDHGAFNSLMRRHGPMVLDVCRSVLGNEADAEDAFQASFLILARKTATIRKQESLGSWLHGVAYRTSLKKRAQTATRKKYEALAPVRRGGELDDLSWLEVRQLMHEDLSKLPERYRAPLVLCYLEGATQDAVAQHLGIAKSTVRLRLEQGRALLRTRLTRRGIGLSCLLAFAAWPTATASAGVPAILMESTRNAVSALAANGACCGVSATVVKLVEGVGKAMILTNVKLASAALLVVLASFGAALKLTQLPAAEPPTKGVAAKDVAKKQGRSSDAPTWKIGQTLRGHEGQLRRVAFSPDGKRLASGSRDRNVLVWEVATQKLLRTLSCSGEIMAVAFGPDGKSLVTASGMTNEEYSISFWDPETGKAQAELKEHTNPIHNLSFSLDGKTMLSASMPIDNTKEVANRGEVIFWNVDSKTKINSLQSEMVYYAALSQDCKRLLTTNSHHNSVKLWKIDENFAATEETDLVQDQICCSAVSADGKTLATAPVSGWASVASLWDFETGKHLISFEHKTASVRCLAFAPDGKTLVTGGWTTSQSDDVADQKQGHEGELAGEIKFWNVATGVEKQTLSQIAPVVSLAFAPDGQTLAVGLLHDEKIIMKKGSGFEPPPEKHKGVVVLCQLKKERD
jgi:RNA polymerase sigma factor (sigma-70 family)